MDRCPDYAVNGFKRYVAMAVMAINIYRIGAIPRQQEQELEKRKKYAIRDTTDDLAELLTRTAPLLCMKFQKSGIALVCLIWKQKMLHERRPSTLHLGRRVLEGKVDEF